MEEEEEDAVERGEDGRDGGLCSWSVPCDLIFRGWASWAGKVLFVRVWKASTERTERRVRGGERWLRARAAAADDVEEVWRERTGNGVKSTSGEGARGGGESERVGYMAGGGGVVVQGLELVPGIDVPVEHRAGEIALQPVTLGTHVQTGAVPAGRAAVDGQDEHLCPLGYAP